MATKISRREFIKISSMAIGGVAVAGVAGRALYRTLHYDNERHVITKTPIYCEMCTFQCAGWAYTKNGKPWKIIGNEADNHSYGRMCTKGSAGFGSYEDPDRLKTPLIRTKERGKQVFREASWDEALDYIAKKMNAIKTAYGLESIALFTHGAGGSFFKTLMKGYGSHSIAAPSYANCRGPRDEAYYITYGEGVNSPENTDMKNSKCIVLIGSHIGENTHSAQVSEFTQALAKGASLIVVDPRFSTAASKAKYWLPIKPATNIALLLAWIHVLIYEDLYNKEYVEKYTFGFEQLKESVRNNTPEWAYPITSIKPEIIRETAREMARHAPATLVHPGRLSVWHGDDTQRLRARAILTALLGAWGSKGGHYLSTKANVPDYPHPEFPKSQKSVKDIYNGKWQLANLGIASALLDATVPAAGSDPGIRGWLVYGTNLIKTLPNKKHTVEAIQKLDLLVAIDTMPAEITGYADVVLPECTYLERYDELRTSHGRIPQIAVRMPVFKPLYNSKPAWWIAKKLAEKMNLARFFPWKNIEEYLDYRLKKAGSSLEEMKKIGVKNIESEYSNYISRGEDFEFPTGTGKIELYSTTLASHGFDPIPVYTPHVEPPKDYYRLLIGRSPSHSFSRSTNNPILTQIDPENEVWINTSVAREWGIENGQYISLKNQDGAGTNSVKARVTERIRPDCVFMVHGFGHTQKQLKQAYKKGAADEDLLTKISYDPIMGGSGILVNFVTFEI